MENNQASNSADTLQQVIEAARRFGIEMDEAEAEEWVQALESRPADYEISVDVHSGIFGHKLVMLDFSQQELEHFRKVGKLVEFSDQPGRVETALALSGSSAQSKIQTYPGDMDFFERVNILAPTREEACQVLAGLMRAKALETLRGPTYQLIEIKFGNYPVTVLRGERTMRAGSPVAWAPAEIEAGEIQGQAPDGAPVTITWEQVSADPGWCKLDWVVADPVHGTLANASNMLDVTWEAPDGTLTPLDGYLDAYFQEVYLDASSIPIFSKLSRQVSADAMDNYVEQLQHEVQKYVSGDPANYGKAAKRMYNIFRLTGRYPEAAYLRELFDEPAALLYQVWSLIRTIDDCCDPGSPIDIEYTLKQADQLVVAVTGALEGEQEVEVIRRLLRLRDTLTHQETNQALTIEAEAARSEVINIVNNFFYEKMTAMPEIKGYIEALK